MFKFNRGSRELVTVKSLIAAPMIFLVGTMSAYAATYYVATTGDDATGDGSLNNPWRTIQKASDNAVAGDTVEIMAGTYSETIVPTNSGTDGSPITYKAHGSDEVIVSGAETVTGWTQYSGNIYRAPISWDPQAVFVDGVDMIEARWPNKTTLNKLTLEGTAVADGPAQQAQGDGRTPNIVIVDDALPGGDDYWNGATVWYTGGGDGHILHINWTAQTSTITDYDSASKTLTITTPFVDFWHRVPAVKSHYYLTGLLSELDAEHEWHYENGYLYLWAPGGVDPATLTVQAKSERKWAFDLEGKSYIHFEGIDVFAGSANMENAHYNVIDDAHFKYINSDPTIIYTYNRGGYGDHVKVAPFWDSTSNDVGIYLGGSNNTLKNSIAEYSYGDVVTVVGESNTVKNNILREANASATESGVISIRGKNHDILANTMYNGGRSIMQFNYVESSRFMYNDISGAGLMSTDLGVAYCYITDGKGTVIAYNWIHDITAANAAGVYLDNGSRNFTLHHNVIWNVTGPGIIYNVPSESMYTYNNTTDRTSHGRSIRFDTPFTDGRTYNNLSDKPWDGTDVQNNITTANAGYVGGSDDGLQFRLAGNSPAIDAGREIAGVTDGYVGSAPDAGAYEFSGEAWIAGHTADVSHLPPLAPVVVPDTLKISNAEIGIEYNAGWDYFPAYYDFPQYQSTFRADIHIANDKDDYFEYQFDGVYIQWVGAKGPDYGMADVYIDGVLVEANVDSYSVGFESQAVLFTKTDLAPGSHTLRVVLNGNKNVASTGFNVALDALESRKEYIPQSAADIVNVKSDTDNLAQTGLGRVAVFVADHFNNSLSIMTDGVKSNANSADSQNGQLKAADYWGISFSEVYGFNQVNYTSGINVADGGWFTSGLSVQVRQNDSWVEVTNLVVSPVYPYDQSASGGNTYTFTFDDTWGDAIRVHGTPVQVGGTTFAFTTISELEIFYKADDGATTPTLANVKDNNNNLAQSGQGRTAEFVTDNGGFAFSVMTDGIKDSANSADSWQWGEIKSEDYWGLNFTETYGFNRVDYTSGVDVTDGGWFTSNLTVQTKQNGQWVNVQNLTVSPTYPYDSSASGANTYSFRFDDTWGDGIRIHGTPVHVSGNNFSFTTIGEFEAYYMEDAPVPVTQTFEDNALTVVANTGAITVVQNYPQFGWSENRQLLWPTTAIGHTLEVSFNVQAAGNYQLQINLTKAADYGNLSFALDGSAISEVDFNGYSNGVVTELHNLGTHTLAEGSHTLTLTVLDKDANSANYFVGIDFLRITPQ